MAQRKRQLGKDNVRETEKQVQTQKQRDRKRDDQIERYGEGERESSFHQLTEQTTQICYLIYRTNTPFQTRFVRLMA